VESRDRRRGVEKARSEEGKLGDEGRKGRTKRSGGKKTVGNREKIRIFSDGTQMAGSARGERGMRAAKALHSRRDVQGPAGGKERSKSG